MSFIRVAEHTAPIRITGTSASHLRIDGKWVPKESTTLDGDADPDLLRSLDLLTTSLPGWPLVEGLDLGAFIPMSHQFIAADMLATPWLSGLIEEDNLRRTRLIIADEGGTGKTLSASIAARWVSVNNLESGPIIVLCPPLLIEEWLLHLKAVFNDDPERVMALGSAKWFDPKLHKNRVLVVSKYSWAYRWNDVAGDGRHTLSQLIKENPPSCVIIDEVHQGRTRYALEDVDEFLERWDEDSSGNIQDREEFCHTSLSEAQALTCSVAATAIGVSATPINLDADEFNGILRILNAEQLQDDHLPTQNNAREPWIMALGELAREARTKQEGESVSGEYLQPLLELMPQLHQNGFLRILNDQQFDEMRDRIEEWVTTELPPALVLRLCRELHPWGRHLAMTLRVDLKEQDDDEARQFRIRNERHVMIDLEDANPLYKEFLDSVECDGELVGIHTGVHNNNWWLRTNLIHSHRWNPMTRNYSDNSGTYDGPPRYSGNWAVNGGPFGQSILDLGDPRLEPLTDAIRADIDGEGADKPSRGCVIFTEFKGTVQSLHRKERNRLIELIDRPNCELKLHILTGDVDYYDARRLLKKCEDEAKLADEYPLLICTPAGEVGLNMAWATTLVHWDLHPNPQRLEQRTWRLDRRLRDDTDFRDKFLVLIPTFKDRWIIDDLINRDNERYDISCLSLGLERRQYIPDPNVDDRSLRPGGSHHHAALLDPEIDNAFDFVNGALEFNEGRGFWMHEGGCIRSFILFSMITKQLPALTLLHEGVLPLDLDGRQVMTLGVSESGMLRDIESISVEVAGRCWPGMTDGTGEISEDVRGVVEEMPQLSMAWKTDNQGERTTRRLPVLRGAMTRLFPKSLSEQVADNIPVATVVDENLPSGRHIIFSHRGLAKASRLSVQEGDSGAVLSDRGLRIMIENQLLKETILEDSVEGAKICKKFVECCINSDYSMEESPQVPPNAGTDCIDERVKELQKRLRELQRRLENYKVKRDEEIEKDDDFNPELDTDHWEVSMETRIDAIGREIETLQNLPLEIDVIGVLIVKDV